MGQSLLGDLVADEVRRGERVVAIDDEAVLLAPFASRLPFQLMLVPRVPRARFEDDGPTGAALLHDGLQRLARRLGANPPLNMWVRTAPRGAEEFCWRIDVMPRLTHLAGLELSTEVNLNIVAPEDAATAAARGLAPPGAETVPVWLGSPMPPEDRLVPRFAAEPPQDTLPYGRWEQRLREEFLAAALALDGAPRGHRPARRARRLVSRTAPGTGAPTCRRPHRPAAGTSCSGTSATCREARKGEPSDFMAYVDFTDDTAERNPDWKLDLCDEVIGSWRGTRTARWRR